MVVLLLKNLLKVLEFMQQFLMIMQNIGKLILQTQADALQKWEMAI